MRIGDFVLSFEFCLSLFFQIMGTSLATLDIILDPEAFVSIIKQTFNVITIIDRDEEP